MNTVTAPIITYLYHCNVPSNRRASNKRVKPKQAAYLSSQITTYISQNVVTFCICSFHQRFVMLAEHFSPATLHPCRVRGHPHEGGHIDCLIPTFKNRKGTYKSYYIIDAPISGTPTTYASLTTQV